MGQPSGFHTGTNSFAQTREQALGGILTKVPQVGKVDQETTQQATSMSQSDQLAAKLIEVANAFSSNVYKQGNGTRSLYEGEA